MSGMPRCTSVFVAALLVRCLACQDEGVARTGPHLELRYHGGEGPGAQAALDVAELAWTHTMAVFGRDVAPKTRPTVHLYRSLADYEAAEAKLTAGRFRRNMAVTLGTARTSLVAVQPPCRDEVLRALGSPGQTAAMLAWETAHLARGEACPNWQDHPQWFVDGLASWVAARVLEKLGHGNPEQAPFGATAIALVQELHRAQKAPRLADILGDGIDDLDMVPRYAVRTVFFAWFVADKERSEKVVDLVRRTGGGSAYRKTVYDGASRELGKGDEAFVKYLLALRPRWLETYRSLTVDGNSWSQLAFADVNAIAWCCDRLAGGIAATGSLRILPGDRQQLNFLFARSEQGFYSIAFTADGGLTVFAFQGGGEPQWQEIGKANAPSLRLGYTSKFAIAARDRTLRVSLDDLHWDFQLPRPLPAEVAWGIGAQAGSAGIWTDVKVGPSK